MIGILRRLISVIAALALVVSLVGLGFCACILPITTQALSTVFADDPGSPFDRTQLVHVADATRDYAFGSHDKLALYRAIYAVDKEYQDSLEAAHGDVPANFPDIAKITDPSQVQQYQQAFERASDVYCYSEAEIAHLDSCYDVFRTALPIMIVAFIVAVGGLVAVGVMGKKRHLGGVLRAGGVALVALLVVLALWALVDFNGFFASFHALLFAEGNWSFPSNSLMICALPLPFWVGMGAVWLIVSIFAACICMGVGVRLRKGRRKHSKD